MQCVLLTKFNVGIRENLPVEKRTTWQMQRLDMFQKLTVRSVLNQTDQKFKWLVFVDLRSEGWVVDALKKCERYRIVKTSAKAVASVRKMIVTNMFPKRGLVSCRLDCDDMIDANYVRRVKLEVSRRKWDPMVVNFRYGYTLRWPEMFARNAGPEISNPFCAFYENCAAETRSLVTLTKHSRMAGLYRTAQVGSGRMWVRVVHNMNVSNRMSRGAVALFPKGRFGLESTRWRA